MRPPLRITLFVSALLTCLCTHAADGIKSTTTYQKAYGESKGAPTVDAAKELPHYPAVEPSAAIATWKVKSCLLYTSPSPRDS